VEVPVEDCKAVREGREQGKKPLPVRIVKPGCHADVPHKDQLDRAEVGRIHLVHRNLELHHFVETLAGLLR